LRCSEGETSNKSAIALKYVDKKPNGRLAQMAAPHLMRSYGRGFSRVWSRARFAVEMPLRDVALKNLGNHGPSNQKAKKNAWSGIVRAFLQVSLLLVVDGCG
jgi:hypothetical protein